jgi:glycosyltransferase 2 family protein
MNPLVSKAFATPKTRLALRAAFGVALLAFVLSRAHLAELRFPGRVSVVAAVGAAAALLAGALVISAIRWWLVLGPGVVPLGVLLRLYFVGQFFSLFLPTSVGGDAVRVLALSRGGSEPGRALSSVLIERLLGVGALVTYLVIGALLTPSLLAGPLQRLTWKLGWGQALLLVVGAGLAALLLGYYGRRWNRLRQLWRDAGDVWERFARSPLLSTTAVITSLLVQLTYIMVWYLLATMVHVAVPLPALLVFVPFVSLAAMLPVSIAGLGIREGAWTLLLQPFGISAANAIGFSLLFYVANLLVGAVGGGIYMVRGAGVERPVPQTA